MAKLLTNTKQLFVGPKGGQYYVNEKGKKVYVKKTSRLMDDSKRHTRYQETGRDNNNDKVFTRKVKRCCCCGKELREDDCNYYDLTDYCPRCALADGIITSLE